MKRKEEGAPVENAMRNWDGLDCDKHTLADFLEMPSPDIFEKARGLNAYLRDYYNKGYYTYCRILTGPAKNRVTILDRFTGKPKKMIMMASNNYLGLSYHPDVIKAGQDALNQYGAGTGSYLLSSCFEIQRKLEEKLSDMKGTEGTILFSSGYAANVGAISALVRRTDVAINDRFNHASIIDGCQLAKCGVEIFRHNDTEHLEELLRLCDTKYDGKLVICESIYSMTGDLSPLDKIAKISAKYKSRLMLDDAYGTGVLGANGHGATEHWGLKGKVDIVMATFTKALGNMGAAVCASKDVISYIRMFARSSFFSASPPPANCAMVLKAIEIMEKENGLRERLNKNRDYMVKQLRSLGFKVAANDSPIISVIVGNDDRLRKMSKLIHEKGLFIAPVPYPAVAKDQVLFRVTVTAIHTQEDLNEAISILEQAGRQHGLI